MTPKQELQEQCRAYGIPFKVRDTAEQLRAYLAEWKSGPLPPAPAPAPAPALTPLAALQQKCAELDIDFKQRHTVEQLTFKLCEYGLTIEEIKALGVSDDSIKSATDWGMPDDPAPAPDSLPQEAFDAAVSEATAQPVTMTEAVNSQRKSQMRLRPFQSLLMASIALTPDIGIPAGRTGVYNDAPRKPGERDTQEIPVITVQPRMTHTTRDSNNRQSKTDRSKSKAARKARRNNRKK